MEAKVQHTTCHTGKDAVLVLGMHRSGTSMLAGILDRLGCRGPNTKLEANDQNPKGYFESTPVFRLNDEILTVAGTRWNDWQPMPEDWLASPRFNEFRSRAAELISTEYEGASMIYLKDPRICRLLPLWRDVFDEMGYRVVCIHTHRHPIDVAASLKARINAEIEPSLGMLSWLHYTLEAEVASRNLPRIFTSYSNLIHDWQGFVHRAEETFAFSWPAKTRAAGERIAQLVDPGLRHHESSIEAFLRDPLVPELFRETLRVLEGWAQNGENRGDRATLDQLRHNFDLSAPLLYAPTKALEAATHEVKLLASHRGAAEERQAAIDALSGKLSEAEGHCGQLLSQQEQMRAELEQNRSDMEEAQAQAGALAIKLEGAEARELEKDTKISELRHNIDLNCHERMVQQAEIDALSCKLAETEEAKARIEILAAKLDDAVSVAMCQRAWLSQVYSVLEYRPWWWALMPKTWIVSQQNARLQRLELFDAQKYLEVYPDVVAGGIDPVRHYICHGMAEGRTCVR